VSIKQQIVNERVEETTRILKVPEDLAFLRVVHSLVTGQSIHAFEQADLVEGGQEKQIDTFTLDAQDAGLTHVYIIQAKNTDGFSSNSLVLLRNGLDWVLNKPRADLANLANVRLRDRILEFRAIRSGDGPSNIAVTVAFVTNGVASERSDEFRQEEKGIVSAYDNGTFSSFELLTWGADELVARINFLERHERRVDAEIPIRYDANNPSLIKYHSQGLKGVICTAQAREIARIVNDDPSESVFDLNVRRFLGVRGSVNSDILRTCTNPETSLQFWFLNNGITIVCDSVEPITDPDNALVKVKNLQIVNGCQTAKTLALAEKAGNLAPDTRVLLRIYETNDSKLVGRVVLSTNNQNKITSRDLRANDDIQVNMERAFQKYAYYYERKPRQFDLVSGIDSNRVIPNELVGQSFLAIVLKKPSDARRRKYKVWGEMYDSIFCGRIVEPYVLAVLIHRETAKWLSQFGTDPDNIKRKLANNGSFHVARIAAQLWVGSGIFGTDEDRLAGQIGQLEGDTKQLEPVFSKALGILHGLVTGSQEYSDDLDVALKSATLDSDIDKSVFALSAQMGQEKKRPA